MAKIMARILSKHAASSRFEVMHYESARGFEEGQANPLPVFAFERERPATESTELTARLLSRSRDGTEQLAIQLFYSVLALQLHVSFTLLFWGGGGLLIRILRKTQ